MMNSNTASPARPLWWSIHLWQIQALRDLFVLAAAAGLLVLGHRLSVVTVPILLALLLAYLLEPLVRLLVRTKYFGRRGAAVVILLVAIGLIVVPVTIGVAAAAVQGVQAASALADTSGDLLTVLRFSQNSREASFGETRVAHDAVAHAYTVEFIPAPGNADATTAAPLATQAYAHLPRPIRHLAVKIMQSRHPTGAPRAAPRATDDAYRMLDTAVAWLQDNAAAIASAVGRRAISSGADAISALWQTLRTVLGLGFALFLTAFFFFYLSSGFTRVTAFTGSLIPDRRRARTLDLVHQMDRVIAGFVRGRLTICAVLTIVYIIGFTLIGVPAPLLLGLIIGLCTLVPYLPALALPIPIILSALEPSGVAWQQSWWWIIFAPIAVNWVAQSLDDYLLTPTIQGQVTQMDTPTIFFASMAGASLAGIYGLLIAIPVAACLKILLREIFLPRLRDWVHGRAEDLLPIAGAQTPPPA